MTTEPKAPQPVAPRYSQSPLPPYRFIPGVNAHPSRHPQGHSFGHTRAGPPVLAPEDWRLNDRYLYGVDLYNAAYWWESHEAWEDVWQTIAKDSPYGQFLQGLIQVSAAFIKWHSGDFVGLEKLFAIGKGRLTSVAQAHGVFMGVDLPQHLQKLETHFAKVLATRDVDLPPLQNYPFIQLKF